jgi:hypothetical protein
MGRVPPQRFDEFVTGSSPASPCADRNATEVDRNPQPHPLTRRSRHAEPITRHGRLDNGIANDDQGLPHPFTAAPESEKLLDRPTVSYVARHLSGLWRRIVCWTIAYALVLQPALVPAVASSLGSLGAGPDEAAFVLCAHDSDAGGIPQHAPNADLSCKLCLNCATEAPLAPALTSLPARSLTPARISFAFTPATIPPSPRLPYQRSRGPPPVA